MEISGGGGSTMKPLGKKILRGGGSNLEKPSVGGGGGMDIFWNHTLIRISRGVPAKGGINLCLVRKYLY